MPIMWYSQIMLIFRDCVSKTKTIKIQEKKH